MHRLNTNLVREKVVFVNEARQDILSDVEDEAGPSIIRSNRIFLKLQQKSTIEKIVIRGQNMHGTVRMAAKVFSQFHKGGPFTSRTFDWQSHWEQTISSYEKEYNTSNWVAVYINGKPVFKTLTSPFADVVEQCALLTLENYDGTMEIAEQVLKQVGRAMRIQHFSNVAASFNEEDDERFHCGIMHRTEDRDTTFSFAVQGGERENRVIQSLAASAAFLEAFNLHFVVSSVHSRLKAKEIPQISPEVRQSRAAAARLGSLNRQLLSFEESFKVRFRPDKPDLFSGL